MRTLAGTSKIGGNLAVMFALKAKCLLRPLGRAWHCFSRPDQREDKAYMSSTSLAGIIMGAGDKESESSKGWDGPAKEHPT